MSGPFDAAAADALRELQPVQNVAGPDGPAPGVGLCLSGGGYRAMLFHLGSLWRLNDAGILRDVKCISSVSGGSITAATLGLAWSALEWSGRRATNLEQRVVGPVRALAGHTIDVPSVLRGALPFASIGGRVAQAYRERVFGDATLQDLPDDTGGQAPRFVLCATNLESGALFRFSRRYLADYRVGRIDRPEVPLATAVAASSAFPPVLSPFEIDLRTADWETMTGNTLTGPQWRGRIKLSDGGVYDNLGLEPVWKNFETVLISDGGGHTPDDDDPPADWPRQTLRVLSVIDNQVRSLRKRQAVGAYKLELRRGAYWGIRSHVDDYGLRRPLPVDPAVAGSLAAVKTRLKALDATEQEQLVNWGFAICDTALRRWVDADLERPGGLPYPASPIG